MTIWTVVKIRLLMRIVRRTCRGFGPEPSRSARALNYVVKIRQLVRIVRPNCRGSGPEGFRAQRLMHFKLKDERFPTNKSMVV